MEVVTLTKLGKTNWFKNELYCFDLKV